VDEAMASARKSIAEAQSGFAKSAGTMLDKVQAMRKKASDSLGPWRTKAADYRDKVPAQLHSAREWTDRFMPTMDKIDSFFTRADDQLDKGIASTRATLASYVVVAGNLEETTYRLKRWPNSFAVKPDAETAQSQDLVWRRDLACRQYLELRGELQRLRDGLTATEASDKARLSRIEEIIRETDSQMEPGAAPAKERPRKGKK
jgi:hypothetical protein